MHQNSYFQLKVYLFEMFEFVFVGRTLACPWDGGGRALEHVPGTRVTANGDRIHMGESQAHYGFFLPHAFPPTRTPQSRGPWNCELALGTIMEP